MFESHVPWMLLQGAWVLAGVVWLLKRNDELPLLISLFLFYVTSFRFISLFQGWAELVDIESYGFSSLTYDTGLDALESISLGQSALLLGYVLFQRAWLPPLAPRLSPNLAAWLKPKLLLFALGAIPVALVCRVLAGEASQTKSLAFEVSSYLYLFPLVLVSVIILMLILWKSGVFTTLLEKRLAQAIIVFSAFLTYSPYSRFQFLGWMIAGTAILGSNYGGWRRGLRMGAGILLTLVMFAAAGALRTAFTDGEENDFRQSAFNRFLSAEDANMLDGFTFLRQVYPDLLPFGYGREHFEILQRPIPRAWWPGKPVGGYMNKLGLISAESGGTTGISPTLFGSLYAEGGVPAMLLLAATYGAIFGKIVAASVRWTTFAAVLVRAILCAWMIPLLRGGDLPNNFACFGMAFWPCLAVLWVQRRELFTSQVFLEKEAAPTRLRHHHHGRP